MTDPSEVSVSWAVASENGVTVVATPDLTVYDPTGQEAARTPAPGNLGDDFAWSNGAVLRDDGTLAVLFQDTTHAAWVQEYDASTLALATKTVLPSGAPSRTGAIVLAAGTFYYLAFRALEGEYFLELHRLEEGSVATSILFPLEHPYHIRGVGTSVATGELVFCAVGGPSYTETRVDLLRIDPNEGRLLTTTVSAPSQVAGMVPCSVASTPDGIIAVWAEETDHGRAVAAVLTPDAKLVTYSRIVLNARPFTSGLLVAGGLVVGLEDPYLGGSELILVPQKTTTDETQASWSVPLPPNAASTARGAVVAGTESRVFVASVVSRGETGAIQLLLQRVIPGSSW